MATQYATDIVTGVRPTGDLTIANYLGAIKPIVELQNQKQSLMVFVADLHALTDNEPDVIKQYTREVVMDYLALGIDPTQTIIYKQSDIAGEVTTLMALLARQISVAELLRVPTLKDKLKTGSRAETANALLLLYPVMMAADILLQKAKQVPVGEDQVSHLEVTRLLAERFNKKYGEVLPLPQPLQVKSLRIQSLKGDGKMSKSHPEGAIFLTDSLDKVAKKIKSAETAFAGEMNDTLASHILVAKELCRSDADREEIDRLVAEHLKGTAVMAEFKQIFARVVQEFLQEFQTKRDEIAKDTARIDTILLEGGKIARANAEATLAAVQSAMQK